MRKRKILLKEKTSENDENDEESGDDEAPEIGEDFPEDGEQVGTYENLAFEQVHHEHDSNLRNRVLGGSRPLPRAQTLPEELYTDPYTLFSAMYGTKIFEEVLDATNAKAQKLKNGTVMYERYFPLNLSDILEFFAHLIVLSIGKIVKMMTCGVF